MIVSHVVVTKRWKWRHINGTTTCWRNTVSTGSGAVEFADIPKSDSSVYQVQRKARSDARMIGIRARRAIEKAEEEAANAGKKKKKKKGKK